ncbi:DUF927 domain-containing protein [Deinococcus apachensis]|uniref:DUF927 domain-containing protein n=1 Tax=Deinococcus apachensis TaxID=309886 RepID=UPI00036A3C76|nr:DUF927 domain-containing protein [Deinococcus apachensis]
MAQANRTTQAAFNRILEGLGGLPFLIDEVHTSEKPRDLENLVYTFANGQSYARGRAGGGVTGGTALGGVVILIGEARPEFRHAGSHNRLLLVNADLHPPLGAGAGKETALGLERAWLLESIWEQGAGHLGPRVAEVILADWGRFRTRVETQRQRPEVLALRDWGHALAAVLATLEVLFEQVLVLPQPEDAAELPRRLAVMLHAHRRESNPAEEMFEEIRTLMLQGNQRPTAKRVDLYLGSEFIGWRTGADWYLLTASRAFRQRLGRQAVQLHGRRWVERGWVVPDSQQGSSTQAVYCAVRGSTGRVLVIPRAVFEEAPGEV